jgi:hypothetical protein
MHVKTLKRDDVQVAPIPDAATAIAGIDSWMEYYSTVYPHSRLGYRLPGAYRHPVSIRRVSGLTKSTPPAASRRLTSEYVHCRIDLSGTAAVRAVVIPALSTCLVRFARSRNAANRCRHRDLELEL